MEKIVDWIIFDLFSGLTGCFTVHVRCECNSTGKYRIYNATKYKTMEISEIKSMHCKKADQNASCWVGDANPECARYYY